MLFFSCVITFSAAARAEEPIKPAVVKKVSEMVASDEDRLIKIFKHCHANPELGFQEVKTAALIAKEWKELGYEVHTGIGKTGVVGILKNGPGPVVMFRGDMDALPVREATGLEYASKAIAPTATGGFGPVMHACGHDTHITYLIGVAKVMKALQTDWSGTLILIAQPAEEIIAGARAMVEDGLYKIVPKADYLIASHVTPMHPAGSASVKAGRRMAGTDQFDVIIQGIGGHGSAPHRTKDPVVMGAMAVIGYQTIVSRSIDPQEPSVVTVGAFHAGDVHNVIPESATLKLNIRWFDPKVRTHLIDSIKRITDAVAISNDMPKDKMPKYIMRGTSGPVVNDEELVRRTEPALGLALGKENVKPGLPTTMGSEDFQILAEPHPETKILFVAIGCGKADVAENLKRGIMPAANHNPKFQVELPAIAAGARANSLVLLELLGRK